MSGVSNMESNARYISKEEQEEIEAKLYELGKYAETYRYILLEYGWTFENGIGIPPKKVKE